MNGRIVMADTNQVEIACCGTHCSKVNVLEYCHGFAHHSMVPSESKGRWGLSRMKPIISNPEKAANI